MRSPLSYVGSKYWIVDQIWGFIPSGTTDMMSAFVGGASIEINLAYYRNIAIDVYDNDVYLINFWTYFIKDPDAIILLVREYLDRFSHEDLVQKKKEMLCVDADLDIASAAFYYLFNKLSYQGMTFSTNSLFRYNKRGDAYYLRVAANKRIPLDVDYSCMKGLSFNCAVSDFADSLMLNDKLALLDPPYVGTETGYIRDKQQNATKWMFDHNLLNEILKQRDSWILFYNHQPELPYIKLAYKDYFHIEHVRKSAFNAAMNRPIIHLVIFSNDLREHAETLYLQVKKNLPPPE